MEQQQIAKSARKITVLGAGAFGSTLGKILQENGHEVTYYDPILEVLLEDALKEAEIQVLAAPSVAVWDLLPRLPREVPLIVATKGLMDDRIFADFKTYEVLSGPGFARDLKDQRTTKLTATGQLVLDLFTRPYLTFDFTEDRHGVLLCGALKNVYAIMAGKGRLEPGTTEYEEFLAAATEEMRAILEANGCQAATVDLSCGVGDLALTCTDSSRNFRFGQKLADNPAVEPEETVEGMATLKRIERGEIEVPLAALMLKELLEECKSRQNEEHASA